MKKILLLLTIVFIIIGCGKKGEKQDKVEISTLNIAFNEDSTGNLNPHEYLPSQFITQDMVYEGLVYYGENGEIKPSLAESWNISKDGKVYTFNLRKNVKFSDGSVFNSENVVKNFNTIFSDENKKNHSWFQLTNLIDSYEAVDEYTFKIVLKNAYTATLYDLAMIRPIRFLGNNGFNEDGNTAKGIKKPIGTGPWILEEHKNNEYSVYVRNENYWGEKPKLKKVIIKVISDSETLALEFEAGNIDIIYGNGLISLDRFNAYKNDSKYITATSEPMSTRMLLLNTKSKILGDINVRKALSHSVDKENIAKNIFGGIEKPANTIFAPNVPNTNVDLIKINYDLLLSEEILEKSGWKKGTDGIREKNGEKMIIKFPYIASKITDKSVGEYIQGELKKIGIDVQLQAMEEKAYWENAAKGNYDIMMNFSWGAPWDPHAFLTAMADNSTENGNPDYEAQLGLPMKEEIDKTIKKLLVEPDENKLKELYSYVLTTLHEQYVYIPISYQALLIVYRKDELKNVNFMSEENRLPVNIISK